MYVRVVFEIVFSLCAVYGLYTLFHEFYIKLAEPKNNPYFVSLTVNTTQQVPELESNIIYAENMIKENKNFAEELIIFIKDDKINRDDLEEELKGCQALQKKYSNIKYYFIN